MTITVIPPLDRTSATFRAEVDTMFSTRIPTLTVELNSLATDLTTKQGLASAAAIATNNDKIATAGDRVQTGADRVQTGLDRAAAEAAAASAGGAAAFSDANPTVRNATDPTKRARLKADLISPGTQRDHQLPDKNGVVALTSDMGSALVGGPLTPTAAPYIDFLTLFTSGAGGFDNYDIIINRVQPLFASSADTLCLRFANAGTVDAAALYASAAVGSGSGSLTSSISGPTIRGQDVQAGNIEIQIRNANSASGSKTVSIRAIGNTLPSASYQIQQHWGLYTGGNAVSGFRLFWASGANFAASGSVRVYGWKNA